jgi:hypothetical protein
MPDVTQPSSDRTQHERRLPTRHRQGEVANRSHRRSQPQRLHSADHGHGSNREPQPSKSRTTTSLGNGRYRYPERSAV